MAIQISGSTVIHDSQDVQVSGVVTATSFHGDASQLTNLPAAGSSLEATASGTLSDGSTIIVNTDGTVSAIQLAGVNHWINTLVGTSNDFVRAIKVDSSGNVYITGQVYLPSTNSNDMIVVKYNSSGVIQWQKYLGGASYTDRGVGIAVDSSGNVYIGGYTYGVGAGGYDAFIVKYNSSY